MMNFGNELQNDVVLYKESLAFFDLIYREVVGCVTDCKIEMRFINSKDFPWHKDENENEIITLQEISNFAEKMKITSFYLWVDSPLDGTIYQYNNYGEKEWLIHGKTKGWA